MKYLVLLSCLFVVALGNEFADKYKDKLFKLVEQCKSELGAGKEDVGPIMKHEAPTTEKGKCFIACLGKKMGFMDQAGKMDIPASYAIIEELKALKDDVYTKMKEVADICLVEVKDAENECETANNIYLCVRREQKARNMAPLMDS